MFRISPEHARNGIIAFRSTTQQTARKRESPPAPQPCPSPPQKVGNKRQRPRGAAPSAPSGFRPRDRPFRHRITCYKRAAPATRLDRPRTRPRRGIMPLAWASPGLAESRDTPRTGARHARPATVSFISAGARDRCICIHLPFASRLACVRRAGGGPHCVRHGSTAIFRGRCCARASRWIEEARAENRRRRKFASNDCAIALAMYV